MCGPALRARLLAVHLQLVPVLRGWPGFPDIFQDICQRMVEAEFSAQLPRDIWEFVSDALCVQIVVKFLACHHSHPRPR